MTTAYLTLTRLRDDTMDRVVHSIEKVQERVRRLSAALTPTGIPYAVIGGNAVGYWVAQVNEAAVRFTRDVDVLIRREDLPGVSKAMEAAGFRYRHVRGIDSLIEGVAAKSVGRTFSSANRRCTASSTLFLGPSINMSMPRTCR